MNSPKISHLLISSSRYPTRTVRTLMRDLHTVLPGSQRINRGKMSMRDLAGKALELGANYVVLVARWRGIPGKLEFYKPYSRGLKLLPPLIYIKGVKLQRDYRLVWRKLRLRPKTLLTLKSPREEALKAAEALSKYFGSEGWAEDVKPEEGVVYLEVGGKPSYITFHSTVKGEVVEIGPLLTIRHLIWRLEKAEGRGGG